MTKDPYYRVCECCGLSSQVVNNGHHLCQRCAEIALAFAIPSLVKQVLSR